MGALWHDGFNRAPVEMNGMIAIKTFLILLVVGVPAAWVAHRLRAKRHRASAREAADEMLRRIVEPAIQALKKNLQMLGDGDIGWRVLAKGESGIALSFIVPRNSSGRGECFSRFREEFPDAAAAMEKNERRVRRVRLAAASLAARLETPVKRQFERHRELVHSDPQGTAAYRDMLLGNEETWMMLLRTLVNDGKYIPDRFARQYGAYWAATSNAYLQLLKDHAAKEHREFEVAKVELRRKSIELVETLRKVSLKLQAHRAMGATGGTPLGR